METKLVKIGNSYGIKIPKALIAQYDLSGAITINPTNQGILITSKKRSRDGWRKQLAKSMASGVQSEGKLLEGFTDDLQIRNGNGS